MKNPIGFKLLAAGAAVSALSACMDIRAVDKNDGEHRAPEAAPTAITVVSTGAWNGYRVFVPAALTAGSLRKSRWNASSKLYVESAFVPARAGDDFFDTDVKPGQTYDYEWGVFHQGVFESRGHARVAVPLDLEVTAEFLAKPEAADALFLTERFGKLRFRPGLTVATHGRSFQWTAEEIIFDRTIIRSFDGPLRAEPGKHGRSGGRVVVTARRLVGEVRFELRGEDGGPGLTGARGAAGAPGARGVTTTQGKGSNLACVSPGGTGGNGQAGATGGKGGDGGDTGEVIVRSSDRAGFHADFDSDPGHGERAAPEAKADSAAREDTLRLAFSRKRGVQVHRDCLARRARGEFLAAYACDRSMTPRFAIEAEVADAVLLPTSEGEPRQASITPFPPALSPGPRCL